MIDGEVSDLLISETMRNLNINTQSSTGPIAIGSALVRQMEHAVLVSFISIRMRRKIIKRRIRSRIFGMKNLLQIVLFIIGSVYTQVSLANTKYVHDEKDRQCLYINSNQKILLAGMNEKTYFFFPCNKIISTYDINFSKGTYLISELLLATSPQVDQKYIRAIKSADNKSADNKLYDDTNFSYFLSTCIPLTKTRNHKLVKYLIDKKENLEKTCDIDNSLLLINQKVFLYDKVGNDFKMGKAYLVKNDKVQVKDYFFKKNELWLYVDYNNSVKKWIPSKSVNL
nr:hypothetical protein [Acinetobacter guillouiae]